MTIELRLLSASVVLDLVHLIASSHLISWQRGYRWTASDREAGVPPLRGLANRVDQATTNFLETFPFFAALVLLAHITNTSYRDRCAFVFLGSCRLSGCCCCRLQSAAFCGVSWQIVPPILGELLNDKDDEKSNRVMQAMLKMTKLDIKKLKQAAKGK
jgi:uncharacterized MAPEG superfamily protein